MTHTTIVELRDGRLVVSVPLGHRVTVEADTDTDDRPRSAIDYLAPDELP
jgi:hypothetical protein